MMCTRNKLQFRRGLSLLEVMIVLVIMVSVTAIVWPNLQKKLQRSTLNESAAMVRELINETRYRASEDGQSYVVRLETGSNELSVGSVNQFLCKPTELDPLASDVVMGSDSDSQGLTEDGLTLKLLPESVVISDVRWSYSSMEEESPFDSNSILESTNAVENNADTLAVSEPRSPSLESIHSHAYWLPILSGNGQGRDVKITLTDTAAMESIDVNYCAATGAVEVIR